MDLTHMLVVLTVGFFLGVTTVLLIAARYLDRKERASRHAAVAAFSEKFDVSYEEADRLVITDPYWPRY